MSKKAERPRATRSKEVWIDDAVIVTQDSRRTVRRGAVQIVDGRIAAIRRSAPSRGSFERIDANGAALIPGFVQAHVHLCQTLFRNQADDLELMDWLSKKIWKMEAAHSRESLEVSALLGIHELLSSGTTCVLDMATVRHTDVIFETVKKTGIRANVGKCLMDHPKHTPRGLREKTEPAISEAIRLFEQWNGAEGDRIRAHFAPRFVLSCTEDLLRRVVSLSKRHQAVIHTHASENLREIREVRRRVRCENVEYLHQLGLTSPRTVLAHCIWLKNGEMQLLRETRTKVAHCPSSNMKLASGFARVPEMRAKGLTVALGADGAPCNNNLDLFQEMRLAALIHKPGSGPRAMRAQDVLDMATRDGAKALSWFEDIGSIEVGKKADLALVDISQPENLAASDRAEDVVSALVYSCGPSHVRRTLVDGRTVYDARSGVPGVDRARLIARARQALRTLRLRST